MKRRTLGYIVILISILVLPYWAYLPVLFVAILLFPFFWEGLLFAFLIDTLYGTGLETVIVALVVLIILLPFRDRLRTYV